ncbi:phosphotransferase [Algibacillus agarilyticus]|uniref:phosphotransferase n=1 Tax=Algibacillus agarilyticus TaxID=2234133 RepID=UPI000DD08FE3|nr:phosphotransferase [Algibacillus agarilyticus]
MDLLAELKMLLNDSELIITEQVQSLWSGYGQIVRCRSLSTHQDYIVKAIAPANASRHPRGWNTSASHERKVKSYQVEAAFYQHYAPLTDLNCKIPNLIASKVTHADTLLVMEDLDEQGYTERKTLATWQELNAAIRWLAFFHARFMGVNHVDNGFNLWPIGTYWHLATRQDELAAMPASEFKTQAQAIDCRLQQAQFKTLVHGDAKFENLCFLPTFDATSDNPEVGLGYKVAAIDFQYVGMGAGVKDLAYLVGSCLQNQQLFDYDERVVEAYLTHLKQALTLYEKPIDFMALTTETKTLYPIAWADFYRFLLGWNPQSWKISDYMKHQAALGLAQL